MGDPTGLASVALGEVFRVGRDAAANILNMKKLAKQLDEEHLQELVPIVQGIVSTMDSMNPNHEDIRGVMQKLETELVDLKEHVSRCRQSGTWNPFKRLSNSKKIIKGKERVQGSQIVATFLSLKMAMVACASASAPASSCRFYCPPVPQHQLVIGMGDYMLKLQSLLLDETGNQWICVSGMGGVGKTLLAQLVCSDPEVRAHFQNRILWVRLGPDCQAMIIELQRDLCEQISQRPARLLQDDRDGRMVLSNLVSKQRYLVILDNAWKRSILEPFDIIGNHNGSKVVVTSRKKDILDDLGAPASRIHVEALSFEDSYTLFCHHAFKEIEAPPNLEDCVCELVRRCGGVPLVVEVVAKAMASKREPRQWEYVLRKIVKGKFQGQQHVFELLRLSYDQLHPFHQKCFLLLAGHSKLGTDLYPYVLPEILIFNYWRSLQMTDDDDDDFEMECHEAVNSLEKASLIKGDRHFKGGFSRPIIYMNDIHIHRRYWGVVTLLCELAMYIIEKDKLPYIFSASLRQESWDWQSLEMVCLEDDAGSGRQRLLEITGGPATSMSLLKFQADYKLAESYFDLLPNLKVLSLDTLGKIPDSIGNLKHLHVLELRGNKPVLKLPNNLVYARLHFRSDTCGINLCAALHQLTKLECLHLFLGKVPQIDLSFLESTSKLRDLQIAGRYSSSSTWTTKATSCFRIKNLFHLKELRLFCKADFLPVDTFESLTKLEHFEISEMECVVDWDCKTLKNLKTFILGSSDLCPKILGKCILASLSESAHSLETLLLPVQMEFSKVPDNFHSLKNLQVSLAVRCPPQSFGSSQAFPLLQMLALNGCGLLAELPALGNLPHLRCLTLSGFAFDRLRVSGQFPALWELENRDWRALVELHPLDGLQNLGKLTLQGLSSLEHLPPLDGLQKLWDLTLQRLPRLKHLPPLNGLQNLAQLTLEGLSSLEHLPPLNGLQNLAQLTLEGLSSLEHLPPLDGLQNLTYLTLEGLSCYPGTLPELQHLTIRRCGMKHLPQSLTVPTSLVTLSLSDWEELEILLPATFAPFMHLKYLSFVGCTRLQSLPLSIATLPSLEELDVTGCSSLRSICGGAPNSESFFPKLQVLRIQDSGVVVVPNHLHKLRCWVDLRDDE